MSRFRTNGRGKTYTDMTFKIIYTFRFQEIRSAERVNAEGVTIPKEWTGGWDTDGSGL